MRTKELTADLDLELLRALQPQDVYTPDFIHPPPSSPLAEFEDELTEMLAVPEERVRGGDRESPTAAFRYRRCCAASSTNPASRWSTSPS